MVLRLLSSLLLCASLLHADSVQTCKAVKGAVVCPSGDVFPDWPSGDAEPPPSSNLQIEPSHAITPPDAFSVDGELWHFIVVDKMPDVTLRGVTVAATHTVKIERGATDFETLRTAIHELLHVAFNASLADFQRGKKYTEHEFIYPSADRLARILADNPTLLAYLNSLSHPSPHPKLACAPHCTLP